MIGPTNAMTVTGTIDPTSVTVGSDTKPIKLVSGVATAVTNDLVTTGNVAQTIDGAKTFSSTLKVNAGENGINIQNNSIDFSNLNNIGNRITMFGKGTMQNNERTMVLRTYYRSNGHCTWYESLLGDQSSGTPSTISLELHHNSPDYGDAFLCPTPSSTAPTTAVITRGYLQGTNEVVHQTGNETVVGKKTLANGLLGQHNETAIPATEQNRWLGIQYTGLTTQFLKFYFVDYINNTSSRLIEGCMFWNGSKANAKVYAKVIGPAFTDPTASMKVTIDTDNKFTVWLKCNYYHSVMRNVEMGRSWTDNITSTFVQIDSPDWTTFDTVKEVEIQ